MTNFQAFLVFLGLILVILLSGEIEISWGSKGKAESKDSKEPNDSE